MKELICITCPRGCHLTVDEELKKVTGNSCNRGEAYGLQEVLDPKRVITSTVTILGADLKRLPVRCDKPISKKLMLDVMKVLDTVTVKSPVKCGDIIVKNILGTDVNIISSRDL
ncbi:CxxC motif-containing protein [Anaeroplasma bactoclasticum]|jgi:CxxC motif-containing protein|uniref:CxxC motif-containing protein n=1 Tax=Anaeroplasma bactoclasticum TaxID=2088 RepID=A0A397RYX2_9MOLU|nr:DUF1667 domain-containing protein [Anaeroplasma bactoclasticum]RIA78472.1 CxxC motif-containing protein [Anaeroplasma bactoclasticum]